MNRGEKNEEIGFLTDCFRKSQIALCANYRGLTVAQISTLRGELRKVNSRGLVVKNTLARRSVQEAFANQGAEKFLEVFEGPTLLVYSFEDPIAPTKVISKFAKENEKFSIKGGYFEGSFLSAGGIEDLSKLPSREEVLGQVLRVISAPATSLVRLLAAPGTQVVRVVDEHRKNLEKSAA